MADDTNHPKAYTAKSIKIMEGLEAVRKRPAMYIGSTSKTGLHHLVYEIVDNSVDEALAGRCDTIVVVLHADGSCSVKDNGHGIPTDIHPTEKVSAAEVVLTKLHAGGKFDKDTYKYSGGLHGVGLSVVNALSQTLMVRIFQNGKIYEQYYERGKPLAPLAVVGDAVEHGTLVRFKPDSAIFPETDFSFDVLSARLREIAFLNRGLHISIHDEENNLHHDFLFKGGIVSLVEDINSKKTPLFSEVIHFEKEEEQHVLEVALQYNDGYNEQLFSFVNTINTVDGGTHVAGFKSALTKACNKKALDLNILKEGDSFSSEDVREGLVAVISMKVPEPQFEGQTKAKLGNSDVKGIVDSLTFAFLNTYFEENPAIARKILQKSEMARHAREAARKARDLARRKTVLESAVLPGKLADCSNEDPSQTELFIVEGNSAGGTAKQARDRDTQAILPLRGKILNVEKAHLERILSSEEIKALIAAIGAGLGDQCDAQKARYHKIILMTDADVDGAHIRTLLLTFFFRYMRPLIELGYLYIAQPPLYKVKIGKKERYLKDDHELRDLLFDWAREQVTMDVGGVPLSDKQWGELLSQFAGYELTLDKVAYDFKLSSEQAHALGVFMLNHGHVATLTESKDFSGLAQLLQSVFTDSQIRYRPITYVPDAQSVQEPLTTHGFVVFQKRAHEWEVPVEFFFSEKTQQLVHKIKALAAFEQAESHVHLVDKERGVFAKGILNVIRTIMEIGKPYMTIQRYKGLGEMNPEQLWETAMDKNSRQLLQVKLEDELGADGWFATLMGDNVQGRRSFIELNGRFVKNLDV